MVNTKSAAMVFDCLKVLNRDKEQLLYKKDVISTRR